MSDGTERWCPGMRASLSAPGKTLTRAGNAAVITTRRIRDAKAVDPQPQGCRITTGKFQTFPSNTTRNW